MSYVTVLSNYENTKIEGRHSSCCFRPVAYDYSRLVLLSTRRLEKVNYNASLEYLKTKLASFLFFVFLVLLLQNSADLFFFFQTYLFRMPFMYPGILLFNEKKINCPSLEKEEILMRDSTTELYYGVGSQSLDFEGIWGSS